MSPFVRVALILCTLSAEAGDEAAAGWVKHPGDPVLDGDMHPGWPR